MTGGGTGGDGREDAGRVKLAVGRPSQRARQRRCMQSGRARAGTERTAGGNQRAEVKALLNRFGLGQGARRFVCRVCVNEGSGRRGESGGARHRQGSGGGGKQEGPGDQAAGQEPAGAGPRRFPTPGRADDAFSLPLPEDQQGVGQRKKTGCLAGETKIYSPHPPRELQETGLYRVGGG